MNKIYLIYTSKNQVKSKKPRTFSRGTILSYFEFLDWPETEIMSVLKNLNIKFSQNDVSKPQVWEFIINFCELSKNENDCYFILPLNKDFIFQNVNAERYVYLNSYTTEDQKTNFSKSFSEHFNDLINYINIENKEIYPEHLNRIIERIET